MYNARGYIVPKVSDRYLQSCIHLIATKKICANILQILDYGWKLEPVMPFLECPKDIETLFECYLGGLKPSTTLATPQLNSAPQNLPICDSLQPFVSTSEKKLLQLGHLFYLAHTPCVKLLLKSV